MGRKSKEAKASEAARRERLDLALSISKSAAYKDDLEIVVSIKWNIRIYIPADLTKDEIRKSVSKRDNPTGTLVLVRPRDEDDERPRDFVLDPKGPGKLFIPKKSGDSETVFYSVNNPIIYIGPHYQMML